MKNMTKKALVGTMAGLMAAAVPFAAFAADETAEPEKAAEAVMEETVEEKSDLEIFLDALLTELEREETTSGEEMCTVEDFEELENALQFVCNFLQIPEVRYETVKYCLDNGNFDMTAEEKEQFATAIRDMTWEDVMETGAFLGEAFSGEKLEAFKENIDAVVKKAQEEEMQKAATELDKALDELGQSLINISADDIMELFQ